MVDPKISQAIELLKNGQVVAMPTETVYGLAASIDDDNGLRRIFSIKKRPFFDPLIVHVSDLHQVGSLTDDWSDLCQSLADHFWPGPLTLVLPKTDRVSDLITAGLSTVGIRMPKHPVAMKLIEGLNTPLAAPSANMFKKTSPTKACHVKEEFPQENLLILDGGDSEVGIESTVLAVEGEKLSLLRPGGVTQEQVTEALRNSSLKFSWKKSSDQKASPGHMEDHYMPKKPLILWKKLWTEDSLSLLQEKARHLTGGEAVIGRELSLGENPAIAARKLYSQMRDLSHDADFIYCIWSKDDQEGLWAAIWNRLSKASSDIL